MQHSPARARRWYAITAAGAAAPLAVVLGSGHTLAWRDSAILMASLRPLVARALHGMHLPLWNPHEALGVPLLAQMLHGVLHPVSVAAALLNPGAGVDALLLVHVLLAAVGSAFLARQLGASPAASAVAGFGYGLSGYVLGMTADLQYLAGAGTAPWVIAALRAAASGRPRAIAIAAVAVAASAFAGDPQWTIVACGIGAALALERDGVRGLGWAASAVTLGAALAAVQIAPTWAYFHETSRSEGLTASDRVQWALSPWRILEFVAPGFFCGRLGPNTAPVFQLLGGPTQYPIPFVPSVFIGGPLLALAAIGVRAGRTTRVLGGIAAALLWIALGTHLGADQLLRFVPVWGDFRYAEKLVGPLTLCIAVLAAFGADRLADRPRSALGLTASAAGAACVLAGGCAAASRLLAGSEVAIAAGRLAIGLAYCGAGLALLAAALLVGSRVAPRVTFPAIASLAIFLQSASASQYALHAGSVDAREEHPLASLPPSGDVVRTAVPLGKVLSVGPPGFDDWDRHVAVLSHMAAVPFNVPSGIDSVQTYTGLVPRRFSDLEILLQREFGPAAWIARRRFGLDYVTLNGVAEVDPDQAAIAGAARAGGVRVVDDETWHFTVWKVPSRPWAFFASGIPASSEPDALRLLADVLERGGPEVVVEGPAMTRFSAGSVVSTSRENERVTIEAESPGDGLLVVNEAYWPGWKATVDGRSLPIFPADVVIRAVPWPAGHHVLEMRYEPPELRAGLAVSAVAAAVLLALWLVPSLSGRRSRPRQARPPDLVDQ